MVVRQLHFTMYDLNLLDGNISAFSDRFITNFTVCPHIFFKESQGQGIVFEYFTLGQGFILGNWTPEQGTISYFPVPPPYTVYL